MGSMQSLRLLGVSWKNLIRDRTRLLISLVGVTFAVLLMLVQSGIYYGFVLSASAVIDQCSADLWIVPTRTVNFESAWPFAEDTTVLVKGTPGIDWAEKLIHTFAYLKLSNGEGRWAQVIGFNPDTGVGGPWKMVRGSVSDLKKPDTYIIDESSLPQLNHPRIGEKLENYNQKIEIAGICRGVKTYTTYPIIFTSLRTIQQQAPFFESRTNFIVARLEPGADRRRVTRRLQRLQYFDVLTSDQFSRRTRHYWATKTGIGVGIGVTIFLGFLVGLVILGQTMYASTMDRLEEYATLKMLGATNLQICSMIWFQAVLIALAGYGLGLLFGHLVKQAYQGEAVAIAFPPQLYLWLFVGTLAMCVAASLLSVSRLLRVSPASVFRV